LKILYDFVVASQPLYEGVFVPKGGNFCGLPRKKVLPLMVAKTATLCKSKKLYIWHPISKKINRNVETGKTGVGVVVVCNRES
jgi:hypothetical protein